MPGFAVPGFPRVGWGELCGPAWFRHWRFPVDGVTTGRRRGGSFLSGVAHKGADLGLRSKAQQKVS